MTIEIIPATRAEAHILAHLWPLYQYDLSEYGGLPINGDGLFEESSIRIHNYRSDLELWWNNPETLHPFLIRVHGRAAGLVLIGSAPHYAPLDRDFEVIEFFLLRGFRNRGVGQSVALDIFGRYPGRWELKVLPENEPAMAFWRKTIAAANSVPFTEEISETDDGDMVIFRFETGIKREN
jgi:predicted acetyltransferase